MDRLVALISGAAALLIAALALSVALGAKGDASGWVLSLIFAGVAAFLARSAWKAWNKSDGHRLNPAGSATRSPTSVTPSNPSVNAVPLEDQISALGDAGLSLAPERTVDELLTSWAREDYEGDPYTLLLFMYGNDVEGAPWGRAFCERGWEFDMECLEQAGDYARAFKRIARITGQPQRVTDLSDDFNVDAKTAQITYGIDGRQRALKARIDDDWADPEAVESYIKDVEAAIGDDRRFWAADNGQGAVLFFITEAEAAKVNALRPDVLQRYVAA